jgi:predicted metal-dependent hydrolase
MTARIERFLLDNQEIEFDLFRKKSVRRNIHVRFGEDGRMRVSAPKRSSIKSVHLVLGEMHDQIAELRRQTLERIQNFPECRYHQDSLHSFLGQTYDLNIKLFQTVKPKVMLWPDRIDIFVNENEEAVVRETLWRWMRNQAEQHFYNRITDITESTDWLRNLPWQLRLRKMKRTWGTCSVAGKITLNPLLMRAPPVYIDYVIAHELCHLIEHNHGPGFYHLLDQLEPNWQNLRLELNEQSQQYLRW